MEVGDGFESFIFKESRGIYNALCFDNCLGGNLFGNIRLFGFSFKSQCYERFNSIKQGNAYTEVIDQSRYQSALINFCTLERGGGNLYSIDADGKEQFHISEPVISFKAEHELKLCVSYTISVPIYFAGAYITSASVPVEVSSVLTEKF